MVTGVKQRMNYLGRGIKKERNAVNAHIANGAVLAGRFAGSKVGKGSLIKVDVMAIYPDPKDPSTGFLLLEQHKKGKTRFPKEKENFYRNDFPERLTVVRDYLEEN